MDSSVFTVNHLAQCIFIEKYWDDVYTVKTTSHCECQLINIIHCIKGIIIRVNYPSSYSIDRKNYNYVNHEKQNNKWLLWFTKIFKLNSKAFWDIKIIKNNQKFSNFSSLILMFANYMFIQKEEEENWNHKLKMLRVKIYGR